MYTTLIDCPTLAGMADAEDVVIVDCRFELSDPGAGERTYRQSHIPRAVYAHLDRDLSGVVSSATGRHPLPDPDALAARLGSWGVDADVQVVAYDQSSGAWAARLWWLLRWLGHAPVAVLDGGFDAWKSAGFPVSAELPQPRPRSFQRRAPLGGAALSSTEVAAAIGSGAIRLVDARSAERFAGRNETVDPVAGHVPGAVSHPHTRNLGADGGFLPAAELTKRWTATLAGRAPAEAVMMCGSGVTACHNLLALEHAGLSGVRLYPGSWSEWICDPARPVATGPTGEAP